jgi:hypothetical protein
MMALPVKMEAMMGEIKLWNYSSSGLARDGWSSEAYWIAATRQNLYIT